MVSHVKKTEFFKEALKSAKEGDISTSKWMGYRVYWLGNSGIRMYYGMLGGNLIISYNPAYQLTMGEEFRLKRAFKKWFRENRR